MPSSQPSTPKASPSTIGDVVHAARTVGRDVAAGDVVADEMPERVAPDAAEEGRAEMLAEPRRPAPRWRSRGGWVPADLAYFGCYVASRQVVAFCAP